MSAVLSPTERLADLEALNREMDGAQPEEVLRLAAAAVPQGRLALVSAFGPASMVTIHLMAELGLRLPVIFIDTLHHFPETLELAERVRARYDLDLRVHRPAENLSQFEGRYGPRLWERDLDRYQRISKVEPFRRATRDFDAWLTGRRRDQARTRHHLPVFEGGEKLRVNPLAGWTAARVWRFLLEHEVPYNPLHDRGYTSIGDEPLTTPILPGEPERAGRWRGLGRLECGIHQS